MVGVEAFVSAMRACIAFGVASLAVIPVLREIIAGATVLTGPGAFAALSVDAAYRASWSAIGVGVMFAVADYVLVRRRWLRELRMTLDEVKRDQKENDGDPQSRSARKALHRNLVRGAIARTKEASFVVVNPTHIAIGIRYAPPAVAVPEILVRAADEQAHRVKLIAQQCGIPIVENVALARALYADGDAGRSIPQATFVAVAQIIAALVREGVLT